MSAQSTLSPRIARCILLTCSLLFSLSAAHAGPVAVGGQWYQFGFDPNHFPAVAGCQPSDPAGVPCRGPGVGSALLDSPPWTFTSTVATQLTITDAFLSGDYFDIFDNGTLIGSTPAVPFGAFCGLDPNVCVADPQFSHAVFTLAPGFHAITVDVYPAQILGEGFMRVTAVPEPGSLLLLGSGLAGFWAQRRSQQSKR